MKILSDLARVKELVKVKSKCLILKLVLCTGGCSFLKQNKTKKPRENGQRVIRGLS